MRHLTRELDRMLRDPHGRYSIFNLNAEDRRYTQDVVEWWITRYWDNLLAVHLNGAISGTTEETRLHCIYLDLSGAIAKLPYRQREALGLVCSGLPRYRTPESNDCVASRLGLSNAGLRSLLKTAYKAISEDLES
jgi:hypothetical protein